jgi:hypothetical protein
MKVFLVLGRYGMDDIPLRLCATKREALEFALTVTMGYVIEAAGDHMNVEVSVVHSVSILELRGSKPQEVEKVIELEMYPEDN